MTDSQEYSTRDLAARLAGQSTGKAFASALRQVQHWTELDHLATLGTKNTGTGRSRLYGHNELYKALILRELVRIGVRVAELEGFGEFLDGAVRLNAREWDAACAGTGEAYLQAHFGPDGAMMWQVSGPNPNLKPLTNEARAASGATPRVTSAVVLNLTRLFAGVSR